MKVFGYELLKMDIIYILEDHKFKIISTLCDPKDGLEKLMML